jgi:hypothetical protein
VRGKGIGHGDKVGVVPPRPPASRQLRSRRVDGRTLIPREARIGTSGVTSVSSVPSGTFVYGTGRAQARAAFRRRGHLRGVGYVGCGPVRPGAAPCLRLMRMRPGPSRVTW